MKHSYGFNYVDLTHAARCQGFPGSHPENGGILYMDHHLPSPERSQKIPGVTDKSFYRKLMVQNVIDPLAAEPLLAEMFCQNRSGHFFQISHLVDRDTAADDLLQI